MALETWQIEEYRLALDLRRQGLDYPQIAMRLKVDLGQAERLVKRAVKSLLKDSAEQIRQQELDRLARLEQELWERALAGARGGPEAPPGAAAAFDRLLRVMAMRLEWSGCRPAPLAPVQITDNRLQVIVQTFSAAPAPGTDGEQRASPAAMLPPLSAELESPAAEQENP